MCFQRQSDFSFLVVLFGDGASYGGMAIVGDLTLHSPRRASMAGSVRDVTAHLLDDAQPDAMRQAEPLAVQQIVGTAPEVPAPVLAGLPARPVGEPTAYAKQA